MPRLPIASARPWAAGKILETCYGSVDRPVAEIIAEAENLVMGASREISDGESGEVEVVLQGCLEELHGRIGGMPSGLPTGLADFDVKLDGIRPGQLVVLAARPSNGKSSLGLDIADDVAFRQGRSDIFSSLEMGRFELGDRILSSMAKVPGSAIRSGRGIGDVEMHEMGRVQERVNGSSVSEAVAQKEAHRRFLPPALREAS